jgi:hypothetical protein
VLQGLEHGPAQLDQEGGEGLGRRDPATDRDRVDEVADRPGVARRRSAAGGGADDDVALSRVAVEQDLVGREQQHERGHAVVLGERPEPVAQLRSYAQGIGATAVLRLRWAGVIAGQVEDRKGTGQPFPPVIPVPLGARSGEVVRLPGAEVPVTSLRGRKGGALVEQAELRQQDQQGPEVQRDVMAAQEEGVRALPVPIEHHPQQRALAEIERAADPQAQIFLQPLIRPSISHDDLERRRPLGRATLEGTLFRLREGRPQLGVPGDQPRQRRPQALGIERTADAQGHM